MSIRIVRPARDNEALPIIFYLHGGAWVAGNTLVYDRPLRELACSAHAAVVFLRYTLAPEARHPVQIEEAYAAMLEVLRNAASLNLDGRRIAVMGDCSGGNMAAGLALLAKRRRGPEIRLQILLYPILANPLSFSERTTVGETRWLSEAALKTRLRLAFPDRLLLEDTIAFPSNCTIVQLNDLPETLVIVAEHDLVRDGAEQFARNLAKAGVRVTCTRYNGATHDFMLLDALAGAPFAQAAWRHVFCALRSALHEGGPSAVSR
ncbi:alpha/beta hydrolase [Rhizobium leguminosarum]|uniref:alpha/beta hydrolase n=1 Tax=Rhizobium leguminosarum TaxID=384 RepID=UPI0013EE4D47|nr:alpha/beta hydrolase [Rhizobium leguminosarum]